MASGNLDVTERYARIEGGHDERRSEHVGIDRTEPGLLSDGPYSAVGGAPVESLAVLATQDGPFGALTYGEINGL